MRDVVALAVDVAEVDVFGCRGELVFEELLAEHGQVPVPGGDVDGGEIHAVEQYLSGVRAVEACEDADQRGLARTVFPYDGDVLAPANGEADAPDHLNIAACVREADVLQFNFLRSLQKRRCVFRVHGHPHEELVVRQIGQVFVNGAQRRHQVVGGGQGPADDLLDVQELAHGLGAGDDLAHYPDQRDHLGPVLQRICGQLPGNVAPLVIKAAPLVGIAEPGPKVHEKADNAVEPHLCDVLRPEEVGLYHSALAARVHLRVPMRNLLPGEFELQVHTGHDGHQHDDGDPPTDQQQGADGQDDRDRLREDRGDPVQDAGIRIREPLGPVVEVNRFLVVVAPEFQRQEALVHLVAHDGAHLEAHELLDVAVDAVEGAPEEAQRRGDDDVDDRTAPRSGVARVCCRQRGGGERRKVGGDKGKDGRNQ